MYMCPYCCEKWKKNVGEFGLIPETGGGYWQPKDMPPAGFYNTITNCPACEQVDDTRADIKTAWRWFVDSLSLISAPGRESTSDIVRSLREEHKALTTWKEA